MGSRTSRTLAAALFGAPAVGVSASFAADPPAVSTTDVVVGEGAGSATSTVTLSAPSDSTVSVESATADGSAKAPADDAARSGSPMSARGETAKTVDIELLDDTVSECNETLWFVLTNPGDATLGRDRAVAAILDNDPMPTVSAVAADAVEAGGAAICASASPLSGH